LIAGPLIAALGFALFAKPSVGESYWKTFFPAVIILGFGMAVTVAPLTTVVMNSVSQKRVGAASGINNAVARVAGVLAIAILGIVMVKVFGSELNRRLDHLSLSPSTQQQLREGEIRLAGLQAPAGLEPEVQRTIENFIELAFVSGFRVVMLICSALSLASAGVASVMIGTSRDAGPVKTP
jgi:hypothetical protein